MSQHIGPRTISAIGGSIKRVGPYRIHTFPSELVTDGLVLNLDAGDPRSYPSSGTTWTDLSGNGNNGTFGGSTAAPTYSNADGGKLVFDGSNDFISVPGSGSLGQLTREITIETWSYFNGTPGSAFQELIRREDSGSRILLSYQNQNVLAFGLQWDNGAQYDELDVGINPSDYANQWVCIQATYDGYTKKLYRNGVLIGAEDTYQGNFPTSSTNFYIGSLNGTSEFFPGNISIVRIYNKCLSAAEVAQNYDALRVRYGSYTSTFTPICAGGEGKVEVLCVAGGGEGGVGDNGQGGGGGGGAGGLIYNSAFTVNSNAGVSLSIGQGGVFNAGYDNGDNTTFGSLTSVGGGSGNGGELTAGANSRKGGDGGSGGGAFRNGDIGGSGIAGQGNDGGNAGSGSTSVGGGGGGGAGSAGQNGNGVVGGAGGSGLSYSISGESKYYAGGGGAGGHNTTGSPGGSGVGGDGGPSTIGLNAIPNTGSGGGGGRGATGITRIGGNGSNGTVIVRYPATDYNVEVLVVGGGGGGGRPYGGGGGAGGLLYYSSYPVSSGQKLTVTVGKGGLGYKDIATPSDGRGNNGDNSVFNTLIAFGGGGGGAWVIDSPTVGKNGGSGGGGGAKNSTTTGAVGGDGVSGQGNSGGNGRQYLNGGGGGGGGASEVGETSLDYYIGADGGDGIAYSISGISTYYAGGGAGGIGSNAGTYTPGTGGLGGGGNGGYAIGGTIQQSGQNGTANTGGGGGGSGGTGQGSAVGTTGNGGDGGSGIVIIAYKGPQRGIGGTVDTTSRPGYTLHKFTTTGTDFFIP